MGQTFSGHIEFVFDEGHSLRGEGTSVIITGPAGDIVFECPAQPQSLKATMEEDHEVLHQLRIPSNIVLLAIYSLLKDQVRVQILKITASADVQVQIEGELERWVNDTNILSYHNSLSNLFNVF